MKVPFVNYPLQYKKIEREADEAIKNVLQKGDLILRKEVEEFEEKLASFVGVKYAVGLNSGTDALILALKAVGLKPGDEVITVSHTFVASIAVICHLGLKPVLVDVKKDFTMDMEQAGQAVTEKTRAILPIHLNGRMCEMDKLMELSEKHNLIVIEDAAQALGSMYDNKKAGSFGLAGCFSFYPAKLLGAFGDAGAAVTNSPEIAEKLRLLRNHGQEKRADNKIKVHLYGFTSRLDNLQAAVLNVKFRRLADWIERRREIAQRYDRGLKEVSGLELPPAPFTDEKHFDNFQNYVLKAEKRDELYDFLKAKQIEILIKDPIANHHHPDLGLSHFSLPYTEELAKKVISLPMYPELENEQIDYVIECLKEFYG